MTAKRILMILVGILVGMQFFQIDKSPHPINPNDIFETIVNPPADILAQLKSSCYNCHSHETRYPWYTYVAPVSFWIGGHIRGARRKVNFSTWGEMSPSDQKHALHECAEVLEIGKMPPKGYVRMHDEAHLDDATKTKLINWFKAQESK